MIYNGKMKRNDLYSTKIFTLSLENGNRIEDFNDLFHQLSP